MVGVDNCILQQKKKDTCNATGSIRGEQKNWEN
jgi:hypothetical protein